MAVHSKKILSIIGGVLIWTLVLVAALFIFLSLSSNQNDGVPSFLGHSFHTVKTESMKGEGKDNFDAGDLIIINKLSDSAIRELKIGDIITFRDIINGVKGLNTHRIISINDAGGMLTFTTKGDNNPVADMDRRLPADVIGIYNGTKISGGGSVMDFTQSFWGFFFCLVLPLALFFIWRVYKLIKAAREYRKFKSEEATEKKDDLAAFENFLG